MKILLFCDSRGQHKPAGQTHPVFGELLQADKRLDVDMYMCPMKWTTTLDFLELYEAQQKVYDAVILYTGIVDWSPRPATSAVNDLYNNQNCINADNTKANTRDYSQKVINNKKRMFDGIFGEKAIQEYYANPFDTEYNGEKTMNMYGLDMARKLLLPRLKKIDNLIFISANRFVPGWEGDFKKGRPANISLTHAYSDMFCEELKGKKVVDLREWNTDEIKKYTCDNLHLSKEGSDYIYERLIKMLDLEKQTTTKLSQPKGLSTQFQPPTTPERFIGPKKAPLLASVKAEKYLATLIIGVRLDPNDPSRLENLKFMLRWLNHYYEDLFEILLIEQDSTPKLDLKALGVTANVRYEFIFNPLEYNRGWCYNVAVKHHCPESKVVALMDTDVLTSSNFVREILDCHTKYDAISPYQNIYYTDEEEARKIRSSFKISELNDSSRVKNPVTVAGGILIIKKKTYLAMQGFEQYVGYSCEDRAFDVTLFNHLPNERIRIAPCSYVHLYHPPGKEDRRRFNEIYAHLISNYGCKYEPSLSPYDFIHKACSHAPVEKTLKLMLERAEDYGNPDLYRHSQDTMSINGIAPGVREKGNARLQTEVIYPPEFAGVDKYKNKEIYANSPEPDSSELAVFYNAYKGKRCFIIGNGPSLNKHDLSLLKDEYTFGVNSFYYKTRESGFRPYFYVVEDSSVMKENIAEIREYDVPFKFFPTNYKNLHPKQPNTFFFRMNRSFYEKSSPNFVVPRFSTDASDVLYCGQSVTYINLQLAYFMGFTEVYLIGMDFSYVIPESHKRTGDVLLSDTDDPNHFHKDYFGKGKTWKDPKLDRVALNYKMAKLAYEATGRSVMNATVGGSLEVFQRVDYNGLFNTDNKATVHNEINKVFSDANALYRDYKFSEALSKYVWLTAADSRFHLYKQSAVNSYMKAMEFKQACSASDVAYVRGLIVGF